MSSSAKKSPEACLNAAESALTSGNALFSPSSYSYPSIPLPESKDAIPFIDVLRVKSGLLTEYVLLMSTAKRGGDTQEVMSRMSEIKEALIKMRPIEAKARYTVEKVAERGEKLRSTLKSGKNAITNPEGGDSGGDGEDGEDDDLADVTRLAREKGGKAKACRGSQVLSRVTISPAGTSGFSNSTNTTSRAPSLRSRRSAAFCSLQGKEEKALGRRGRRRRHLQGPPPTGRRLRLQGW